MICANGALMQFDGKHRKLNCLFGRSNAFGFAVTGAERAAKEISLPLLKADISSTSMGSTLLLSLLDHCHIFISIPIAFSRLKAHDFRIHAHIRLTQSNDSQPKEGSKKNGSDSVQWNELKIYLRMLHAHRKN